MLLRDLPWVVPEGRGSPRVYLSNHYAIYDNEDGTYDLVTTSNYGPDYWHLPAVETQCLLIAWNATPEETTT
jgi:hypothetical protein